MTVNQINLERRRFLTTATTVVGGMGIAFATTPFAMSWSPSAKTESMGGPIKINISKLSIGQQVTVPWRGQPIFVINRSTLVLEQLNKETQLRDPQSLESEQPEYTQNRLRSLREQYLVVIGLCTHLGCVPLFKPKAKSIDASWVGGFFCPCHGSKYDMAGRVYKGVPAPTNLPIPPHYYISDSVLVIGAHGTI